jgi:hypothetical protein
MRLVLEKTSFEASPDSMNLLIGLAAADFAFLRENYPSFDFWFQRKVLPGIAAGERTVLVEIREGRLIGLAILKHSAGEKKLCTLRVRPEFECRGLGVRMFESAFEILGTARPLLSVSDLSLPKFTRLFDHFGFSCEAAYRGLYTPRTTEFSFNGLLVEEPRASGPQHRGAASVTLEAREPGSQLAHGLQRLKAA